MKASAPVVSRIAPLPPPAAPCRDARGFAVAGVCDGAVDPQRDAHPPPIRAVRDTNWQRLCRPAPSTSARSSGTSRRANPFSSFTFSSESARSPPRRPHNRPTEQLAQPGRDRSSRRIGTPARARRVQGGGRWRPSRWRSAARGPLAIAAAIKVGRLQWRLQQQARVVHDGTARATHEHHRCRRRAAAGGGADAPFVSTPSRASSSIRAPCAWIPLWSRGARVGRSACGAARRRRRSWRRCRRRLGERCATPSSATGCDATHTVLSMHVRPTRSPPPPPPPPLARHGGRRRRPFLLVHLELDPRGAHRGAVRRARSGRSPPCHASRAASRHRRPPEARRRARSLPEPACRGR